MATLMPEDTFRNTRDENVFKKMVAKLDYPIILYVTILDQGTLCKSKYQCDIGHA